MLERLELRIERMARKRIVPGHQDFAVHAPDDLDQDPPLALRQIDHFVDDLEPFILGHGYLLSSARREHRAPHPD
ncbi:hypothetical protein D3C85_1757640 [compost metagenome]